VTARGNERRDIFRGDRDRQDFLSRLADGRNRFGFHLLAYCLMTNHFHLAIRTAATPLSRIMACLQSSYAQRFNRRHARVGHLFQGRYKSRVVQEDRYFETLIRYIHQNPVRARITRRAADYPWSSDRHLRRARGPSWLDVDETLAALGPNRRAAVARYIELVDGPAVSDELPSVAQAVVGDEAFAVERFTAAGELDPPIPGLTEDRVLEAVADETGLSPTELAGPARGGEVAFARCLAACIGRRFGRISVRRMARRLRRDDSSFARPLARLEARLPSDEALGRQIDRIVRRLKSPDPARRPPANSAKQD
jgi:REP element-mobilizing transposase RayT